MDLSHYLNKDLALDFLSQKLHDGTLALFLGSGTSSNLGLPEWHDLLIKLDIECLKLIDREFDKSLYAPRVTKDSVAQELQDEADRIIAKFASNDTFLNSLTKVLYPEDFDFINVNRLIHNELLMSLGALMIGSKRGSVNKVITLNYDSILEWYLNIYGYVSNVVFELPTIEGNEDVTIFHPHGFLPHSSMNMLRSSFTILGLDSVFDRLGQAGGDLWFEKIRHLLRSKIWLFIGTSIRTFKDPAIRPLINSVHKEISEDRPLGFWIVVGDLSDDDRDGFLNKNIVPITLPNKEAVPNFLFNICTRTY